MTMAQKTALLVKPLYWNHCYFCSSAEVKERDGNKHIETEEQNKCIRKIHHHY